MLLMRLPGNPICMSMAASSSCYCSQSSKQNSLPVLHSIVSDLMENLPFRHALLNGGTTFFFFFAHSKFYSDSLVRTFIQEKRTYCSLVWSSAGLSYHKIPCTEYYGFPFNPLRANYCHTWHMENHPFVWRRIRRVRRIKYVWPVKG